MSVGLPFALLFLFSIVGPSIGHVEWAMNGSWTDASSAVEIVRQYVGGYLSPASVECVQLKFHVSQSVMCQANIYFNLLFRRRFFTPILPQQPLR